MDGARAKQGHPLNKWRGHLCLVALKHDRHNHILEEQQTDHLCTDLLLTLTSQETDLQSFGSDIRMSHPSLFELLARAAMTPSATHAEVPVA